MHRLQNTTIQFSWPQMPRLIWRFETKHKAKNIVSGAPPKLLSENFLDVNRSQTRKYSSISTYNKKNIFKKSCGRSFKIYFRHPVRRKQSYIYFWPMRIEIMRSRRAPYLACEGLTLFHVVISHSFCSFLLFQLCHVLALLGLRPLIPSLSHSAILWPGPVW